MSEEKQHGGRQQPPAGWYVDPWSRAEKRYWDGSRWTEHAHGVARRKPASWDNFTNNPVRLVAGCGGAGLVVAPFLPWVSVVFLGDLNLFQLLRVGGHTSGLGWLAVAIGAGVAITAYLHPKLTTVRVTAFAAGLLAGAYSAIVLTSLVHDVERARGLARVRWGPYVAVAACVAMLVAALLKEKKTRVPLRPPPA
jgi:uncharacterized protein DUF2510